MTLNNIASLRTELPELFEQKQLPQDWDENWIAIPFDDEIEDLLNPPNNYDDYDYEDNREVLQIPRHPEIKDIFPEYIDYYKWNKKGGERKLPPDLLAFYLPFHLFPDDWGIYILSSGVQYLAKIIRRQCNLTQFEALLVSRLFLYYHELYHHKIEMFFTRLEVTHKQPFYKNRKFFRDQEQRLSFNLTHLEDKLKLTEEALANAEAYIRTVDKLAAISQIVGNTKISPTVIEPVLSEYIRSSPAGYNEALLYDRTCLFNAKQYEFANQIHTTVLPNKANTSPKIWSLFFDQVDDEKTYPVMDRVFILFDIHSSLVRGNPGLQICKPRALKKKLSKMDCYLLREGKEHEVWVSPSGKHFTIPRHPGDMKPGTVRNIFRDAGLDLSYSEIKGI
ncbi:MAG: type II toxin-antitoxin system HicA family toxin [Crinalium sp.]